MNEQRPSQQWIVKVNGVEEVRLDPGESLEIGRKPLRPLADNGMRRLDVPDDTRSMSKRHAVFSVSDTGSGVMRDLGSTNGTYVVRDDGALMRVPEDTDFLLPRGTMRFQFGDVPVDCIRVDAIDDEPDQAVPDLFSYAAADAPQEPDAADMSVDDILDLRAGEPTGAFDAGMVRSRIGAIRAQALAGATAEDAVVDGADANGAGGASGVNGLNGVNDAGGRDLFADAIDEVQTGAASEGAQPTAFGATQSVAPGVAQPARSVPTQSVQPAQSVQFAQPIASPQPQPQPMPYEPGSVFDRVSRGEFAAARPVIEAGGHTSDQARTTRDFATQFDMARYPQLLPFLAMNPALYDDLYAWLAAQGNRDIDAALDGNEGYHDYLAATGK
ncbi:Tfp pilus assembly protein [Bifidobacterium sp. DSM 109958]|uniref:Tfp pilus assembly protein n=1 Tax=Bifidobacterium moraviense TaxID=2675323 RepID=A0A7Y0F1D1_9BIFI|nr:Tfp pilus assembly protein [Bifidobacterium sp. DSM 109958]